MRKKLTVFHGSVSDNSDYTMDYYYPNSGAYGYGGERKSLYERSATCRVIMDCGTCFSKYILCLFNFIILAAGAGVLFLGVWMYTDRDSLLQFAKSIDGSAIPELEQYSHPEVITYLSYILMAIGAFMFILSILGYCGALRESRCLLGFYGFLLVVILILEIAAIGLAFVYKDRAQNEVHHLLKDTLRNNYSLDPEKKDNASTQFFNAIMINMQCCGIDNYTDFQNLNLGGLKVPPACCVMNQNHTLFDQDCPNNPTLTNSYKDMGCLNIIMHKITEHMTIVIYVVIGLVIIELLSIFLSFCLCKSLEPYDK